MKLSEIAKLLDGEFTGKDDIDISRVAKIEDAGPGDISFLANLKYKKYLTTTRAGALLIARNSEFEELRQRPALNIIRVADPYTAFLRMIDIFTPSAQQLAPGIHPTAVIAASAAIGNNAAIGAHVVIGDRCAIGDNVSIYPGTVLGTDVTIGENSLLYPNITVREHCIIGKRVIIHSSTVVGSDGFGFAPKPDGSYEKIPQRGIVIIEDDVEIGANCSIDRATLGETRIKRGAKLDNLIQVAHNVVIGEHTVIAGQTGISGSTKIGNYCVIAGQVGLPGHIEIADHTTIGAKSGIPKSITEPGKTFFGYPAKEHGRAFRIEAVIRQLPELSEQIYELNKRIQELESTLNVKTSERK